MPAVHSWIIHKSLTMAMGPSDRQARRKSVQNIRKITRTMELIATARFKKARLTARPRRRPTPRKIAELVADLGATSLEVSHPAPGAGLREGQAFLAPRPDEQSRAGRQVQRATSLRVATRVLHDDETEGVATALEARRQSRWDQLLPGSGASPSTRVTPITRTGRSSTTSKSWRTVTSASM